MKGEADKLLNSCLLTDQEQRIRAEKLSVQIFQRAKKLIELKNGWDIIFHEPIEFANDLIEMINFERVCCPYFHWSLIFEPENRAIHLQIYGSDLIKEELRNAFSDLEVNIPA
jgi:hypothetical protein